MKPTPIFFIHQNFSFYLKYSLNQARFYNPDCEIKVIIDEKYPIQSSIELIEMSKFRNRALKFKARYIHLSHLPFEFEYFCFARWIILAEYISNSNYENEEVICLDSDVMLYCNFNNKKEQLFKEYDITVSNEIGPQYTWFAKKETLFNFVDFIFEYYSNEEKTNELKIEFNMRLNEGRPDGISDMTLLRLFIEKHNLKCYDFAVHASTEYFDNNINCSDGFKLTNGLKNIIKIGNSLFVESLNTNCRVVLNALHFQGKSKYKIHRYYTATFPDLNRSVLWQELFLQLKLLFGKNGKISVIKMLKIFRKER